MAEVEFTAWATDILQRSQEAARRFAPGARVRLARAGDGMEPSFADAPEPGDREVRVGGVTILVEEGLEGLVDVEEPHDRLVLRPAGSAPSPRHHHEGDGS